MININHHVYFFDLNQNQKEMISSKFKEELVTKNDADVLYIYGSDLSIRNDLRSFAAENDLSLNLLYMSEDRHIHGIDHFRNGEYEEIQIEDRDYYKLTEELWDIDYFSGLTIGSIDFTKAVAAYLVHYVSETDSQLVYINSIFNNDVYFYVKGFPQTLGYEIKMAINSDTGIVTIQNQSMNISCPDIRGTDGLEVFENFLEEEFFDFIDAHLMNVG